MSKNERAPGGLSMFSALLHDRVEDVGGTRLYAKKLGVSPQTLWSWMRDRRSPLFKTRSRELITKDTDLDAAELGTLGKIGIKEACSLVLEIERDGDPVEQDLKNRFMEVVAERGSDIPGAAYAIYLQRGRQENRQKLVSLLETTTPPSMSVNAMQYFLDQLPVPRQS